MPGQSVRLLKIFIASPGDVKLEREKAREEILNLRTLAHNHGFDLEAVGWETHVAPGMGRGQALINPLVRACDLFIGILSRKFGAHTGEAESGTLEEFHLARERFAQEHAPEIMLYFREVHPDFLSDPGPQLQKVLDFKRQIEDGRLALYKEYRNEEHFATLLRQHVTDWLLKLAPAANDQQPTTNNASAHDAPPLSAFTEHLEYCRTELQKTARPLRLRTLTLPPLFLEEVEVERPRNMKVSIAVKTFPRLLILGEPGAGKTTSLKKLAEEYARWRGEGKEPGMNEPEDFNLPIFVDLSAYPTLSRGDEKHGLWRLITASVRGVHDVDVRKRIVAGGCLLLFDGLNEVGEAYDEVVHQIRHLVNSEAPHNRFVVTCRPGIYRNELHAEFIAFQLERLSSFNASKVLEIEIGEAKAQSAWRGLDEYTRDLCRNPLMLTLLADELRASETPPTNRAELFDRFIDRYLSEWARVKGAGSVRVEKEILSALAWRLGTSRTLLSADEAAATMSARLAQLQMKKEVVAELDISTLNHDLLNHGFLQERIGQTGFFHQAIQEYFIAREAALHHSAATISQLFIETDSTEVVVFLSGLLNDSTEVLKAGMQFDLNFAAKCAMHAKYADERVIDEIAVGLAHKLKEDFGAEDWVSKSYDIMLALNFLEHKMPLVNIVKIFLQVYGQKERALYDFVRMLVGMDRAEKAIPIIKPFVDEDPDNIRLRGSLAWALQHAGRFDDAIFHCEKCLEISSEQAWIWGGLGVIYKTLGKYDEAVKSLVRAIGIDPGLFWAYYNLGLTFKAQGRFDEAIMQYRQAIAINMDYGPAHLALAEIYDETLQQPERAILEYEASFKLERRPERTKFLFGLARALEAAGRTAEARQRYQEYLDRFPWGEHAQEAQAALERLGEG